MSDRRDITLSEYDSDTVPAHLLSDADLQRLGPLARKRFASLKRVAAGWQIDTGPVVGTLTLDHIRLVVQPKFLQDGRQVLAWLRFAAGDPPIPVDVQRGWATDATGLPDLVVAALLRECRTLLRGQLRRDYRPAERVEAVLRGRLDIQRQISRRFGQVDRLHVRTFERDTSGWENVVCGIALRRAATVTRPSPLTAESLTLAESFPHPGAGFDARRTLRRATYHRMNARYRAAHRWAALLLGGGGPTDLLAEGAAEADSLLIDMNRLWERVVTELVRRAVLLSGGKVVTAASRPITVHESARPARSLLPDVLARWPSDTLPIDAKYKKYDETTVSPDDVHQLLTYARAHCGDGSARAVVVHPSRRGMTARKVLVTGPGGPMAEIAIVGVDASRDPLEAVGHVSQALEATRSTR